MESSSPSVQARVSIASARKPPLSKVPLFEGMDGLASKVFMWDDETGTVINTYVWDSEAAARAFFTPEVKALVVEHYGVEPQVRFTEVTALVDNRVGVG